MTALNILNEESSTHPRAEITHPQQIIHGKLQKQQKRQYNRGEVVQSLANDKFERTGEGLTSWDLWKGRYKLVSTDKQAQYLLYNAKNAGYLHPRPIMTIPQQYFATKDQAELAVINSKKNKKIIHPNPTGVKASQRDKNALYAAKNYCYYNTAIAATATVNLDDHEVAAIEYAKYQEDLKVNDTASAMYLLTSGAIPVGMHKIHIHLDLNPDFVHEAYHTRLRDIPPDKANNEAKKLECRIDNYYLVKYFVHPRGSVDIYIPCTRRPFPIDIYDADTTNTNIICFAGEIRQFLSNNGLKDYSDRIVPKLQEWRLLRADINFDIRCSVTKYEITSNIQMTKFGHVFRVYKKMIDGKTYIRFEQDKVFDNNTPFFDHTIGSTIISAAREAQQELRVGGGV